MAQFAKPQQAAADEVVLTIARQALRSPWSPETVGSACPLHPWTEQVLARLPPPPEPQLRPRHPRTLRLDRSRSKRPRDSIILRNSWCIPSEPVAPVGPPPHPPHWHPHPRRLRYHRRPRHPQRPHCHRLHPPHLHPPHRPFLLHRQHLLPGVALQLLLPCQCLEKRRPTERNPTTTAQIQIDHRSPSPAL